MTPSVHYDVRFIDPAAHHVSVTLTVQDPDPEGQIIALPAWIPGSYTIRFFARHIRNIVAAGPDGPLTLERLDSDRWRIPPTAGPVTVTSLHYCWDLSVRTAHVDRTHAFFNGTSLFLQVLGQTEGAHSVTLHEPDDAACSAWRVATTLTRTDGQNWGFGSFSAVDYDELVDHPVECSDFDLVSFEACGVPHHVAVTGRHRGDLDRFAADLVPICEAHIKMFGEPAPYHEYLFLLTVVGDGFGGLEHRRSTALISKRSCLPLPGHPKITDDYRQLLSLCSHEYFHNWNVKRIKPAAFTPYDFSQPNHTTLLWAFEGITRYYDDQGLFRAGLTTATEWLEALGKVMTRVRRTPGRHAMSLSDSSYDAWTKLYKHDEDSPNSLVNYYTKGALVALALDLRLRRAGSGLDELMRRQWAAWQATGAGVAEDGVEALAAELAGEDLSSFFDNGVRGTGDLHLTDLLAEFGVALKFRVREGKDDTGGKVGSGSAPAASLGGHLVEKGGGAALQHAYSGGAAQAAGLSAGDIIMAWGGLKASPATVIRDLKVRAPGDVVRVHAFRRDELIEADVTLQAPDPDTAYLELVEEPTAGAAALRLAWLGV